MFSHRGSQKGKNALRYFDWFDKLTTGRLSIDKLMTDGRLRDVNNKI
jgi:hypothetical protein